MGMTAIALYDAECPFCRSSMALLLAWDRRRRLEPVALQTPRAAQLLARMSEEERMESWHLIENGKVRSAGAAFPPMMRLMRGGRLPARLAELSPRFTQAAYEWVSEHKATLAKGIPEAVRRRADRLILERTAAAESHRPGQPAR